jgi:hypothetical protein
MRMAVDGAATMRGHCTFRWQLQDDPPRRMFFVDDRHCRPCLRALRDEIPGVLLAWSDRDESLAAGPEPTSGKRRIGRHCVFSWEAIDDLSFRGQPLRMFWTRPEHCAECVEILKLLVRNEPGAVVTHSRARSAPPPS